MLSYTVRYVEQRGSRLPYVRTLPQPGECNSLDTWGKKSNKFRVESTYTAGLRDVLLDAEVEEMAWLPAELRLASLERRQWTEEVYRESVKGKERLFGGRDVVLQEFVHFTCLVSSVRDAR